MSSSPKHILSAGFGRFAQGDPNATTRFGPDAGATVKQMLQESISKAKAAGFEVVPCDMNPRDPEDSLARFVTELQNDEGREWVAVNVGFGVRGHKENTILFERLLNEAWRIRPGLKFMFSNGPDDLIEAVRRTFPESFQ